MLINLPENVAEVKTKKFKVKVKN